MSTLSATPNDVIRDVDLVQGTSLWLDGYKRLRKNKMALAGGIIVIAMVVMSFIGPFIVRATWGYDYETMNLDYGAQPPSWADAWPRTSSVEPRPTRSAMPSRPE